MCSVYGVYGQQETREVAGDGDKLLEVLNMITSPNSLASFCALFLLVIFAKVCCVPCHSGNCQV